MSNVHPMKTRSKTKKKITTKIISGSSSDSRDDDDDFDNKGNIKGLIDYDDNVNYHKPDKNRKRKIKMNSNNGIKKSRTKEDNILSDIFLEYISKWGYDVKKVKVMTALIFLNIAMFHHYPYCHLLFYLGKNLLNNILED